MAICASLMGLVLVNLRYQIDAFWGNYVGWMREAGVRLQISADGSHKLACSVRLSARPLLIFTTEPQTP